MTKEEQYIEAKESALKITDKLGKPIDKDIIELVIYLNLLGIQTVQSCEGHHEEKNSYFFVDFKFWCYKHMNKYLSECFDRWSPFEYSFIYDPSNKETIIRLQPYNKENLYHTTLLRKKFENYLEKKFYSNE